MDLSKPKSRDISALLVYEARRRPLLQSMLDHLSDYTEAQIEQAPFLKWIRQALIAQKRDTAFRQSCMGDHDWIVDGVQPDPLGTQHCWIGPDSFVRISLAGGAIQVRPGDLLWCPLTGGVWIETIFTQQCDHRLLSQTRQEGLVSKSDYITAYRAQKQRLVPTSAHAAPSPPSGRLASSSLLSSTDSLTAYGVRFQA